MAATLPVLADGNFSPTTMGFSWVPTKGRKCPRSILTGAPAPVLRSATPGISPVIPQNHLWTMQRSRHALGRRATTGRYHAALLFVAKRRGAHPRPHGPPTGPSSRQSSEYTSNDPTNPRVCTENAPDNMDRTWLFASFGAPEQPEKETINALPRHPLCLSTGRVAPGQVS